MSLETETSKLANSRHTGCSDRSILVCPSVLKKFFKLKMSSGAGIAAWALPKVGHKRILQVALMWLIGAIFMVFLYVSDT